jgi:hypothetical protein
MKFGAVKAKQGATGESLDVHLNRGMGGNLSVRFG